VAQFERDRDNLQGRNRYLEKELERITSKYQHELNVALGKPSTQSSISHWSIGKTKEEDARGGNDGCITSQYGFHTDEEENPWWLVDLGSVYLVNNVRIFNRHEVAHRLRHFSILGSTDGTDWTLLHRKSDEIIFGEKLDPYDVSFEGGTTARFIKVQLNGRGFLHFHECLVFGRSIHDGQTVPGDVQRMQAASHGLEPCIVDYLEGPGPHALELGRRTPRPGWLASDLSPEPGAVRIDVTKPFPIADNAFAFASSEHSI
jgi:hypothetical protein